MSALDLYLSRKALAAGVGLTTRRNKVLPPAAADAAIPDRVGIGHPLREAAEAVIEDRTFVFSLFGGTTATIANRIAGSTAMQIVRTGMAVLAATYNIGRLNTFLSKWRDCWRIDADTFGINGNVPPDTVGVGVVPTHERSTLPFIAHDGSYYATCGGDATRSTLFLVKAQETVHPTVLSLTITGTLKSTHIATIWANTTYSSAGARIASDEKIRFYGNKMAQTADTVFRVAGGWSVFLASRTAPYVQELDNLVAPDLLLRGNPYISDYNGINYTGSNTHTSGGYSITPTLCPFYIGMSVTNRSFPVAPPYYPMEWDETYDDYYYLTAGDYVNGGVGAQSSTSVSTTQNNNVTEYCYVGADIQVSKTATLEINYASARRTAVRYYPYTSGGSPASFSGGSETVVTANSNIKTTLAVSSALAALGDLSRIVCTLTGNYSYSDIYVPAVLSHDLYGVTSHQYVSYPSEAARDAAIAIQDGPDYNKIIYPANLTPHSVVRSDQRGVVFTGTTRDYIFADIDEDIFLSLDAVLTLNRTETYNFTTLAWSTSSETFNLDLKYVLRVRGSVTEFSVYNGSGFTVPVIETASIFAADASVNSLENFHGLYHVGYKPVPVFAPPFMAQGNCPYIAYTTAAEEAAGAPAELYLDMSVRVRKYTNFSGTRYDGVVPFVPHQFQAMFRRYIGGEQKSNYPTYPLTQNTTFWDTLFPSATPYRIQFANGVSGAWNTALGAPFAANPTTEITRL